MDVDEELRCLIERGHLGLGIIAADRGVIARRGALSAWLPAEGSDCCASAVLTGMEDELAALVGITAGEDGDLFEAEMLVARKTASAGHLAQA